uniref:TsaA-like domain-containing protein n=1 Tax=Denticeps clupeoides TaxID=299321 RepID=A0AAY4AUG5_9TELE
MSARCSCGGDTAKKLCHQISVMRKELKNLRQLAVGSTRLHTKHMGSLQALLSGTDQGALQAGACQHTAVDAEHVSLEEGCIQTVPIGFISSCFAVKNGTPRQPTICSVSRATLQIQQSVFNNPDHSLAGLEHYSHVWIIFVFHKNAHLSYKAKVKPPRLNGLRVGVYSTRSPHRPNALGLTLAKLERVVVHGKPRFKFLKDGDEAAAAILAVLSADPRSAYRRARCRDRLFFFTMDTADITCWFGEGFAEVLRVQPHCKELLL